MELETLKEDEEYSEWKEVKLPVVLTAAKSSKSRREMGWEQQMKLSSKSVREMGGWSQRRGRDILIAVDHGPNSKLAFDWAINHLCHFDDTVHLLHAVSSTSNEILYDTSQTLMEKLCIQAIQTSKGLPDRKPCVARYGSHKNNCFIPRTIANEVSNSRSIPSHGHTDASLNLGLFGIQWSFHGHMSKPSPIENNSVLLQKIPSRHNTFLDKRRITLRKEPRKCYN